MDGCNPGGQVWPTRNLIAGNVCAEYGLQDVG